jgi:hypothetical protein
VAATVVEDAAADAENASLLVGGKLDVPDLLPRMERR